MSLMPELRELNGQKVLHVDNKPFLILSFQLNCDYCYDPRRIDRLMEQARRMGCNTVALLLYWRLIEPQEGQFDYSILESMLSSAIKHDLRIVLVWFGSYKNATMHYACLLYTSDVYKRQENRTPSAAIWNTVNDSTASTTDSAKRAPTT